MTLAPDEGGRLVAALAAEPGFAELAEPDFVVLFWRPATEEPVWASPGGRELLKRLPINLDGTPHIPRATAARLRLLAEGLAPRSSVRLERLGWGGMESPLTFACRLASFEGEDYLLTALPRSGRALRGKAAAPAQPASPMPATRQDPEETSQPTSATVVLPLPRGVRFMWRSDSEHRFSFVSSELVELVGERGADVIGLRWDEIVGRLVQDSEGAVGSAWDRGGDWRRLAVGWRDPDRDRLIPVELTGAPIRAEEPGAPTAYRGFGIAYPARSRAIGPGEFQEIPQRGMADSTSDAPRWPDDATQDEIATSMGAVTAALTGKTDDTVFNMLRAWLVPAEGGAVHAGAARMTDEAGQSTATVSLTSTEQGALHEIARALQGADGQPAPTDRPSAEIVQLARMRPRPEPTALLDQIPVGCVVLRDGGPLFANRRILDDLRFASLPDAVGRGALQNLAKVAPDAASPGIVSLSDADGIPRPFSTRVARVDWGELAADLVLLVGPPEGPAAEVDALRLDLASRDQRLEEGRVALDLAADAVMTLDPAARLLSLSRSAERLFGIGANEVVGDSITALIEPRDHRTVLARLDALRSNPLSSVQQCEVRGRIRSGGTIPLSMRAGHVPGPAGGFCVAFNDISHFRLLEKDLREARATAEEASANRAEFLARISHEVRTPLTAITGFAELMLDERFGALGNERYKGYIRDIRDSGVHVISLVNDLLDLAKATSGAEDLDPEPLDLNAVVQQCVALASPLAGQEKTIVRTSFPGGLPYVYADERSIRQIVINLLSNAIRFTGAGGQVIVSTALSGPSEVVLSVRDTGPGMSEQEVATALTPFRQVQSTRRGDGTGLGLPLSKALTEANGGVFLVTSARDLGTLVEVRLPVAAQGAVAAE